MIVKMEVVESELGESFVYQNGYSNQDILLADKPDHLSEPTAWLLLPAETIGLHLAAGAVIYAKTRARMEESNTNYND